MPGEERPQVNTSRDRVKMDSTAAVWTGARPYDDYSRGLDYYSRGLGPVTGHAAHEVAGAGAVTSAWSTVPPSSLAGAGAGLEERQHEDTVSRIGHWTLRQRGLLLPGLAWAKLLDHDQAGLTEIKS